MLTDFLKLTLTDKSETGMTFLEWRTLMNGVDCDSNMELIDGSLARLYNRVDGKADGFTLDPETGVLQLTSFGEPIEGAAVTINLNKYYTKDEVDKFLAELEETVANNDTITAIQQSALSNLSWDEGNRSLTMYNLNGDPVGDTIVITGGGGGGGVSYSVRLMSGMESTTFTTATSASTVLKATFKEYYGMEETGVAGTLEVAYKLSTSGAWTDFISMPVSHGVEFEVDVTSILTADKTTNVRLRVTGGESKMTQSITYNITQVEASISAINFDDSATYTGNFDFVYRCVGKDLNKTVHFEIDGSDAVTPVDIGTSHNANRIQTIQMIGKYAYGAHDFVVYFTTSDGAKSNVLKFSVMYNDGTSADPIIGIVPEHDEITYGDTIRVRYAVFTPGQETTDEVNIRVYSISDVGEVDHYTNKMVNVPNNQADVWQTTNYPDSGIAYIEFSSGKTVETVEVRVNEIESEYDLHPVETNLVYKYSAAGRSNNDASKEVYECRYTTAAGVTTKIKGTSDGFNWISNGYVDGESLTISGEARHTIELPMFSTGYVDSDGQTVSLESTAGSTVTTNGRTFEIEFKVSNVTDINAHIIECMSSDHAGFVVTPQNCWLLASNGVNVALDETGFIENEQSIAAAYIKDGTRIRLSFVIEPLGSVQYTDNNGNAMSGQCIDIYINGQFANSFPYSDSYRFNSGEYITMGSDTCILNVYDIRIYNRGLTDEEIMQNYMSSPLSVQDRIVRFEDNDVLTDSGDVDYDEAVKKYNCLLVTGQLSPFKGANDPLFGREEKYACGLTLTKPDGVGGYVTEFNLLDKDADGAWMCSNNVQGTSSRKFPIKNYKVYLAKAEVADDGTISSKKVKYALKGKDADGNELSIGESTLCWKADYMSSDHANTFNANLADTLFTDKTPAQQANPLVQNTIYGFRCLLFQRDDENSPIRFAGDGALNNDKGNSKSFGLEDSSDKGADTKCQKWEFLNNTEDLCKFKSDIMMASGSDGSPVVTAALESCYPDQGDLKEEGLMPNYDHIQVLWTWVCQRANFWDASTDTLETPLTYNGVSYTTERDYRKAIFKAEFSQHFNLNHALVYYLFMEFVALCDNRGKNLFLSCFDVRSEQLISTSGQQMSISDAIDPVTGEVDADMIDWDKSTFATWYTVLYDLDSCFGVENSGYLWIPYYADWNYTLNGDNKFNSNDSRLWLMFEEAMANEIRDEAQLITDRNPGFGGLNYSALYDVHIRNNAELVCPAVVNRDMQYKYHDPWIEGFVNYAEEGHPIQYISDYKYMQRGSRTQQKDAFIYRRANMLYSKYQCNKFLNSNINFRSGADLTIDESYLTVTTNQTLYPAARFSDTSSAALAISPRTEAGEACVIQKPGTAGIGTTDTIYIGGAPFLTDIGDISRFVPYELQLQNATGLRRLIIGSSEEGYTNTQLTDIRPSECKLLEEINIMGCTALSDVDLSNNGLLKKVYAGNSSATMIKLPNGGVLEELHLGTISDLAVLNHKNLAVFTCDSYDSVTMLHVENTPLIPTKEIVESRLGLLTGGIRLVGIDWTLDSTELLERLMSNEAKGKYINKDGALSDDPNAYPYISGVIHIDMIGTYLASMLNSIYPDLIIDAGSTVTQYSVDFVNWDGSLLDRQYIYQGQNAVDPIKRDINPIPVPTRPSTVSTIYTCDPDDAWDGKFTQISKNTTIFAKYTETLQRYTVRWYNGNHLLKSVETDYGTSVEYDGDIPTDASGESYLTYKLFDGWDNSTYFVNGNIDAHAKFTSATAPTDKALEEMSPTELYALVRTGVLSSEGNNNTIIASGDTIDAVLGKDYNFNNVDSTEFVSVGSPAVFDGTSHINTGIKLFDEDKSFVLAIDFEFASTENNSILAGCLEGNGFSLTYNSNPVIRFGAERAQVSSGTTREIVVIRKALGSNDLHVYSSSKASTEPSYTKLSGVATITHNAPLSFGANVLSNGYVGSYASGTIHWAKLWDGDLGDTICRNLASWTRNITTFEAAGSSEYKFRMFKTEDNTKYVNCCFLAKDLLDVYQIMSEKDTNIGGWADTSLRTWLNSRVLSALPDQWQLIMQKALVSSSAGNGSVELVTSADYIWIPSSKEVGNGITIPAYDNESEDTFSIFVDDKSRIKHFGGESGNATAWWLRSPHYEDSDIKDDYFNIVAETGYVSLGWPKQKNMYGVCFGFCI